MSESREKIMNDINHIICPACGAMVLDDKSFCTTCGNDLNKVRDSRTFASTDEYLIRLTEKYQTAKRRKRIAGWIMIASIVMFYGWLEYNLPEFFADLALFAFPISLVAFIAICFKTYTSNKKLNDELVEKTGQTLRDLGLE